METVIILGRKPENTQRAISIAFCILWVSCAKETFDGEFTTFDPDFRSFVHPVKDDGTAVCWRDDDAWVIWCGAGASVGFKFAVEEFVERSEALDGVEDFAHVELMEGDEAGYFRDRLWVIIFDALLERKPFEEFANCFC